ncbi:MAG TPA: hypothetical protein VFW75_06220 [Acetobacteraceae bacterium]|nr:hypothetical protein [Acetobacteraceae bacterium]
MTVRHPVQRDHGILHRRSFAVLALGWYGIKPGSTPIVRTPVQYKGNQERDFLAVLRPIIERSTHVSAFSLGRPCLTCLTGSATLKDIDARNLVAIAPAQAKRLSNLLSTPGSYDWTATVMGSQRFSPELGFYFTAAEPLAAFLVAPSKEYGLGQLLLPTVQPYPSLTFVVLTKASTAAIVSVFSSVNPPPRRGIMP